MFRSEKKSTKKFLSHFWWAENCRSPIPNHLDKTFQITGDDENAPDFPIEFHSAQRCLLLSLRFLVPCHFICGKKFNLGLSFNKVCFNKNCLKNSVFLGGRHFHLTTDVSRKQIKFFYVSKSHSIEQKPLLKNFFRFFGNSTSHQVTCLVDFESIRKPLKYSVFVIILFDNEAAERVHNSY